VDWLVYLEIQMFPGYAIKGQLWLGHVTIIFSITAK